jgi:hypothetical protein
MFKKKVRFLFGQTMYITYEYIQTVTYLVSSCLSDIL